MIRRLFGVTLVLLLLFPMMTIHAQDGDDINAIVDAAIAFLSEQLNVPITRSHISRWTWEETYWPDSSMGCPQAGAEYAQVMTRGYIITLTFNDGVYEVHITADGNAVFCGSQAAPPPTPLPETATPPAPATTLDEDALVNLGIDFLNAQLGTDIRRTGLSRWTWEEAVWSDASLGCPQPGVEYDSSVPIQGYIVTIEYVGTVYEMHMTPDGQRIMPCNNEALQPVVDGVPVTGGALGATATATPAVIAPPDGGSSPQMLYTSADGHVYLSSLENFPGQQITFATTDIAPTPAPLALYDHDYGYYRWSPDGQFAAFVDNARPAHLLITDAIGTTPLIINEELTPLYPPAWKPDGTEVAFVSPTQTFRANRQVMNVLAVAIPKQGAITTPRLLGTFEQEVGCGGGGPDPANAAFEREAGFMGNTLTFEWLPDDRLLLTPGCMGVGLAQLDLQTGTYSMLDNTVTRVALAPDRTQAAGIVFDKPQNPTLVILSIYGDREPVMLDYPPDQVAWAADGTALFISEVEAVETLTQASTQSAFTIYTVRLWSYDIATGLSTLQFEQEGRGIGRMVGAPDNSGLLFSFVESSRAWLQAQNTGQSVEAQREAAPHAWLMFLTSDGEVVRLGPGGQPAFQPLINAAQG